MQAQDKAEESREGRLTRMMSQHKTSLMRMAYLYLGDTSLSEDAVQETFLRAYKYMDSFRAESSEKTWLVRIAINVCKDMRATSWMRFFRTPLDALPEPTKEDRYTDDTVVRAVMNLPARDKQVILLRYYQDLKVKEIAEVLNITVPGASSRLKRAKGRLQAALKGWYFDED